MLFEATVSYSTKDASHLERSSTIHYSASSFEDAMAAPERWFRNRNEAMPEYFDKLLCVKVYTFDPKPIETNGYLPSASSFSLFEWKCDWGRTYAEQVQSAYLRFIKND